MSTGQGLIVSAGTHVVLAVAGGIGVVVAAAMEGDDSDALIAGGIVSLLSIYAASAVMLSTLSSMHASKSCDTISSSLIAGGVGSVIGVALAMMILIIFTGLAIDNSDISIGDMMKEYFEEAFVATAIANAAAGIGGAYLGGLGHLKVDEAPSLGNMHQQQMDAMQTMPQQGYENPPQY